MGIPALTAFSRDIPESTGLRIPTAQSPENPYFSLHPPHIQLSGELNSITEYILENCHQKDEKHQTSFIQSHQLLT